VTTAAQRLARRRQLAKARPAVDLTSRIASDVIDQGPRPTCVACAVAVTHEAERSNFEAAIEPVWWRLRGWNMADNHGTTLQAAGQALPHTGHCEAKLWPYNKELGYDTEPPPAEAGAPPWFRARLDAVTIEHDGVEDAIEDQLAAEHPVILVIEISDSFLAPEPNGFISVPPITAPTAGYHAVVAVGAWTDTTYGRVFLIRNSWGDYWGASGYGIISPDYLVNFGAQAAKLSI
jgi:hypothetical protein